MRIGVLNQPCPTIVEADTPPTGEVGQEKSAGLGGLAVLRAPPGP